MVCETILPRPVLFADGLRKQALALIERTAPTSDNASCSQETRRTAHWPGWLTASYGAVVG